ncbi:hypothetical protein [Sphingopyxis terrae]|uniref:hypothetical protein n=1 Tax=Sphingopyxis terrae TaxID=33052 RepID=UPI0020D1FB75|nr:hypothetical protein [Sphingopyxis terrae]
MVKIDTERRSRQIGEHRLYLAFIDNLAFDFRKCFDRRPLRQELHRAHTIAANAFEQAVIIGAFGSGPLSDRFANIRIVGKEIFENCGDGGAAIGGFA